MQSSSSTDATARQLTGYYGRRWGIECGLRDAKDAESADWMALVPLNLRFHVYNEGAPIESVAVCERAAQIVDAQT